MNAYVGYEIKTQTKVRVYYWTETYYTLDSV